MKELNVILKDLRKRGSKKNRDGMARYGINIEHAYGVSVMEIRKIARPYRKNHLLALDLWETGIHEARIYAIVIDDPEKVTKKQMQKWVRDFNSWDICDLTCMHLFCKTKWAHDIAVEWSNKKSEFVRRAGFTLMVSLAVHDKAAADSRFESFFPLIKSQSTDDRNFVKKAVNWALRGIGKRNMRLNKKALTLAEEILKIDSRSSRWIARDAIRELKSDKIIQRIRKKEAGRK